MNKDNDDKWNDLPSDLLIALAARLDFPGNIKFSAVCKSWKSATCVSELPHPTSPYLLLAEAYEAAPTVCKSWNDDDEHIHHVDVDDSTSDSDVDGDDDDDSSDEYDSNDDQDSETDADSDDGDEEDSEVDDDEGINKLVKIDEYLNNINEKTKDDQVDNKTIRGLFCLSTGKTYNIDLPQASGKLVLGTNKGWLLTLGRDSEINLLHPFTKHQIALPPMLTFASQYDERITVEQAFHMFITKVAMSTTIPTSDDVNRPLPVVMAIYGEFRVLGFARPGDKLWIDVKVVSGGFEDVVYHKNKFYGVTIDKVYECGIDDGNEKRGLWTKEIVSIPLKVRTDTRPYLVESSSGHDLLLIVRFRKGTPYRGRYTRKYYTSKFLLWKMEQTNSVCNWKPVTNVGNESLFIGSTSSFSVSSSETIKPNCIYFTDDSEFFHGMGGGGHDMGIFSIEHGTIEPHFRGKSIHPFSPPLWYI